MTDIYNRLARDCADIALKAAIPVLDLYQKAFSARTKADGSPVTDADIAADKIIRESLQACWPDIPIVSEEHIGETHQPLPRFFLVDPLDGTQEFINHRDAFTINIALIEDGKSVAGVIYAPARGALFLAGERAFMQSAINPDTGIHAEYLIAIATRKADRNALIALASRSHSDPQTDAFLDAFRPHAIRRSGSSLKFCLIAKGDADFYPRFSPTMGWDIAAGHAILNAAGGMVIAASGQSLNYDSQNLGNGPFLAIADHTLQPEFRAKFAEHVREQTRGD